MGAQPYIELDLTDRTPTPTQERFLNDERTRVKALLGGLGSGKTSTGAEAFLDIVLANPGCVTQMVAPTHQMLVDLCIPAFEAACPKELILAHVKSEKRYDLIGGRQVKYGSAEKPSSLEGKNLAGWWCDEARYFPRESWRNMLARLRDSRARRLQGIVTSTPAMGWLAEEFDSGKAGRVVYRISTRENEKNLAPGYIDDLKSSYSERLVKSLVEGHFTVIEGQVYEVFEDERHVVDWTVDLSLPVTIWMDFGVRKSSVAFAQHTSSHLYTMGGLNKTMPPSSHVVFDELQPEQKPTERVIPMIQAKLREHGIQQVAAIFCDPAGRARDIASGMPSVHLLEQAFGRIVRYQTDPRFTWIPNGVAIVEGLLSPAEGSPRLYVARKLAQQSQRTKDNDYSRGVVKMLRGLQYPPAKDGRTVSDHPVKDGHLEHAGDMVRYGCVNAELWLGRPVRTPLSINYGG